MSASVNKLIVIGHLGRDPEERRTQAGGRVVTFSVATSEHWTDKATGARKEATNWHNVAVFAEPLCEVAMKWLKKGAQVYLEGMSLTRKWETKAGETRYATELVLKDFNGRLTLLDRAEKAPGPDGDSYGAESGETPPPF